MFEELELWNSLITCYSLMDKKAQATELIKKRLEVDPDDAGLLCSLGDCTGNEQMYHDAWEKSNKRSGASGSCASAYSSPRTNNCCSRYLRLLNILSPFDSARAMRSLADSAHRRKEYGKAAEFWEAALSLNPLHSNGWFSIGHCYIQQQQHDKAVRVRHLIMSELFSCLKS